MAKKPPREEFNSKGGSTIDLGHFKNKTMRNTPYNEKMLLHDQQCNNIQLGSLKSGLDQTRFHTGFNRRPESKIHKQYFEEGRKRSQEYQAQKDKRNEEISKIRQSTLIKNDARAGYDIISGNIKGQGPPPSKPQGPRMLGDGLGPEAPARGKSILRESEVARFFTPLATGANHEHRQKVLYNEGLLNEKGCGILQIGKHEMKSHGIEDQFSKSEYTKNSVVARTGLVESRVPGKYTPRKVDGNPSGNNAIVQQWNTNIDLSNRTLRNIA